MANASNFTNKQKQEQLAELHKHIDHELDKQKDQWSMLLKANDTETYMQLFSQCVEDATALYANLSAKQYKQLMGRSTINIKSQKDQPPATYNHDTQQMEAPVSHEAARLMRQCRRLQLIKGSADKLHNPTKHTNLEEAKKRALITAIRESTDAFLRNCKDWDNTQELVDYLSQRREEANYSLFFLERYARNSINASWICTNKATKQLPKTSNTGTMGRKPHRHISNILKANTPAPMACLKRDLDGGINKPRGSFTTDPKEMHKILRRAWEKITHGSTGDLKQIANKFINKYSSYYHRATQWELDDLSIDDFKEICKAGTDSAAGLDGWAARDMALLSEHSLQLVADLLNAIERGAPWPTHMLQARAAFLSKDPNDTSNPLAYRIPKITSGWYRKWASCRNKNLEQWITTWGHPALNSGVPGKGAQDAWHKIAMEHELKLLKGEQIAGGSVDIFKRFDQLNRELIYQLALNAGMPRRILDPYMRYISHLQVRYQVGKTIGEANIDRASIPQGCPFSMTMVALIMLPWIKLMEELEVTPRVLADDLLFTASGPGHRAKVIRAMEMSRTYFQDIGAKVADNKCFTFATDSRTRNKLKHHTWNNTSCPIPTFNNFRDLGTY